MGNGYYFFELESSDIILLPGIFSAGFGGESYKFQKRVKQ